MAQVRFFLSNKVNSDNLSEITLRLSAGRGIAFSAKTTIFIEPQYWEPELRINPKTEKNTIFDGHIRIPKREIEGKSYYERINALLNKLRAEILDRIRVDTPNKEWLKDLIDRFVNPDKYERIEKEKAEKEAEQRHQEEIRQKAKEEKRRRQEEKTLFETVADFIEYAPKRMQDNGKPLSRGTLWQYGQMRRSLAEFAKSCNRKDWAIKEVNKNFYDGYVEFLYGLGYKMNTVGKHIKNLKAAINSLPAQQRNVCEFIEYKKCKKLAEDVDNVYLNEEELSILANIELTDAQDRVRDQFLLLAWTGCRYSDLPQISAINRKGNVLKIEQTKTGATPAIPLFPEVERIFAKYDNGNAMPPVIENQAFNRAIKEICRLAGFKSQESITHTINGKRVKDFYEKWELVSAHTARRSFATNLYKRGFPTIGIMKLTGHKTEKAFHTYIKVNAEENAEMMMELWNKMSEE